MGQMTYWNSEIAEARAQMIAARIGYAVAPDVVTRQRMLDAQWIYDASLYRSDHGPAVQERLPGSPRPAKTQAQLLASH